MREATIVETVKAVILNEKADFEIANNLESIIEASLDLCKTFFPNKNPEVIFLEDDVYEHYSKLEEIDQHKIINKVLRNYFSEKGSGKGRHNEQSY